MGEGVLIRSDQPSSHDAGITNSLVYKKKLCRAKENTKSTLEIHHRPFLLQFDNLQAKMTSNQRSLLMEAFPYSFFVAAAHFWAERKARVPISRFFRLSVRPSVKASL